MKKLECIVLENNEVEVIVLKKVHRFTNQSTLVLAKILIESEMKNMKVETQE